MRRAFTFAEFTLFRCPQCGRKVRRDGITVGHSRVHVKNRYWRSLGMYCPYEHCIEDRPQNGGEADCFHFGHDCPGGGWQARACRRLGKYAQL
jgi:hypothetical protein